MYMICVYVHQNGYLFSSYFYERLKSNPSYAIEVAEKKKVNFF